MSQFLNTLCQAIEVVKSVVHHLVSFQHTIQFKTIILQSLLCVMCVILKF